MGWAVSPSIPNFKLPVHTKPVGKGTGMGLSISYQIVTERHGGSLKCISEEEKGAEFIITIPVCANATKAP